MARIYTYTHTNTKKKIYTQPTHTHTHTHTQLQLPSTCRNGMAAADAAVEEGGEGMEVRVARAARRKVGRGDRMRKGLSAFEEDQSLFYMGARVDLHGVRRVKYLFGSGSYLRFVSSGSYPKNLIKKGLGPCYACHDRSLLLRMPPEFRFISLPEHDSYPRDSIRKHTL